MINTGVQLARNSSTFPFKCDGASRPAHFAAQSSSINDAPTRTPSPPTASNTDDNASYASNNTIFPRRKAGEPTRLNSKPVVLNDSVLRQLFTLPLHEAAVRLGISATAMKSACRKLGIKKWPYRSSHGVKSGGGSARRSGGNNSSNNSSSNSGSDSSSIMWPAIALSNASTCSMPARLEHIPQIPPPPHPALHELIVLVFFILQL
jgi:hypothetical protein